MARTTITYRALKSAASHAKKKAALDDIQRPLSYWQELLAQSFGWESFHAAGAELGAHEPQSPLAAGFGARAALSSTASGTASPSLNSRSGGFACSTLGDFELLVDAMSVSCSLSSSGYSSLAKGGKGVLMDKLRSSASDRAAFLASPVDFCAGIFDPARALSSGFELSDLLDDEAVVSDLLDDEAVAYLWDFGSQTGARECVGPYPGREEALAKIRPDAEQLGRSAKTWIEAARAAERLLDLDPELAPRVHEFPVHATPLSIISASFKDEGWTRNSDLARVLPPLMARSAYRSRSFYLSDLVREWTEPFLSGADREALARVVRALFDTASFEKIQATSDSWREGLRSIGA